LTGFTGDTGINVGLAIDLGSTGRIQLHKCATNLRCRAQRLDNQQEQAEFNYARIIKFPLEETPSKAQIFVCGMNSELLSSFMEKAKAIELNENKFLSK
jgi:hypothetical protein